MGFSLKDFFKKNNMEFQFWGYEGGNVLATVAGAGGFAAFSESVLSVANDQSLSLAEKFLELSAEHPDATVTLGLGATVLLAPVVRGIAQKAKSQISVDVIDAATATAAIGILGYALTQDASWITISGSSFVVGSSFLRASAKNPFFLKAGSLALAFGAAALSVFGLEGMMDPELNRNILETSMHALTFGTGLSVFGASTLTYQGGMYETRSYLAEHEGDAAPEGWVSGLVDPKHGSLAKMFERVLDKPISAFNEHVVKPAVVWVPEKIKSGKPFETSMHMRLPFRVVTGGLAMATGNYAFAAANGGWAVGDVAIGSIDWDDKPAVEGADIVVVEDPGNDM